MCSGGVWVRGTLKIHCAGGLLPCIQEFRWTDVYGAFLWVWNMSPLLPGPLHRPIPSPRYSQKQPGLQVQKPEWLEVQLLELKATRMPLQIKCCTLWWVPLSMKISNKSSDDSSSGCGRRKYATGSLENLGFTSSKMLWFLKRFVKGNMGQLITSHFFCWSVLPGTAMPTGPHCHSGWTRPHSHPEGSRSLNGWGIYAHGDFCLRVWGHPPRWRQIPWILQFKLYEVEETGLKGELKRGLNLGLPKAKFHAH